MLWPHGAFQLLQRPALAGMNEQNRLAAAPCPAGAADPVDVGFVVVRQVVVHDMADAVDVQPARSHIGRHQHIDLPRPQPLDNPLPLLLYEVAAQGGGLESRLGKLLGDRFRGAAHLHEDQCAVDRLRFENPGQHGRLLVRGGDDVALVDRVGRRGLLNDRHFGRIAQVLLRNFADRRRHRCREQSDLPAGGRLRHHPVDVGGEAPSATSRPLRRAPGTAAPANRGRRAASGPSPAPACRPRLARPVAAAETAPDSPGRRRSPPSSARTAAGRTCRKTPRLESPIPASASAPTPASGDQPGRSAAAAATRTRPSCRFRSAPGRRCHGLPTTAESPAPESEWATRSRPSRPQRAATRSAPSRRTRRRRSDRLGCSNWFRSSRLLPPASVQVIVTGRRPRQRGRSSAWRRELQDRAWVYQCPAERRFDSVASA